MLVGGIFVALLTAVSGRSAAAGLAAGVCLAPVLGGSANEVAPQQIHRPAATTAVLVNNFLCLMAFSFHNT
jgi:hypothetical protein